jgi:hypothetical protein
MNISAIFRPLRHPVTLGLLLIVCAGLGILGYRSEAQLATDVSVYAASQRVFSEAAFLPGSSSNPDRDAANRALAAVLSGEGTPAERLAHAQDGLVFLKVLEGEIDAIATARDTAEGARTQLSNDRYSLTALPWEKRLVELNALAIKHASIIADIRGLSYSANYHSNEIFKQIVADIGELKPSFIAKLNSEIPEVEQDFNRRSNLYLDLQQVDSDIRHVLSGLPGGE